MNENVIEFNLPVWISKVIGFIFAVRYWMTNPVIMYRIKFKGGWIPLSVCKQIKFLDMADGTTVFRHDKLPGEYRVKIDARTDYEDVMDNIIEFFTDYKVLKGPAPKSRKKRK